MPVYQVVSQSGTVTDAQRREVATAITDAHVAVTGAPAFFVNVVFQDLQENRLFTGGSPSTASIISGVIRAGRTPEDKKRLLLELNSAWCRITGAASSDVLIGLTDIDPSSAMEAGLLFPAPGQEAQWIAANQEALASLAGEHQARAGQA